MAKCDAYLLCWHGESFPCFLYNEAAPGGKASLKLKQVLANIQTTGWIDPPFLKMYEYQHIHLWHLQKYKKGQNAINLWTYIY